MSSRHKRRTLQNGCTSDESKRWVEERNFGWLARFRRLARHYERLANTLTNLALARFSRSTPLQSQLPKRITGSSLRLHSRGDRDDHRLADCPGDVEDALCPLG